MFNLYFFLLCFSFDVRKEDLITYSLNLDVENNLEENIFKTSGKPTYIIVIDISPGFEVKQGLSVYMKIQNYY